MSEKIGVLDFLKRFFSGSKSKFYLTVKLLICIASAGFFGSLSFLHFEPSSYENYFVPYILSSPEATIIGVISIIGAIPSMILTFYFIMKLHDMQNNSLR